MHNTLELGAYYWACIFSSVEKQLVLIKSESECIIIFDKRGLVKNNVLFGINEDMVSEKVNLPKNTDIAKYLQDNYTEYLV